MPFLNCQDKIIEINTRPKLTLNYLPSILFSTEMKGFLLSITSTTTMKLIKQLASIAILVIIFLIGYYFPNCLLYGGLILCCLNYIHEDHKRFKGTFTAPYSPDRPSQIPLPPIECNSINWTLYDYKSLRRLAKYFSIPANQKKTVLIDALNQIAKQVCD